MMSMEALLKQNPLEMYSKWSEGQLELLGRRQRKIRETTEAALGVFRDSLDGKAPEESLKKLCGGIFELYSLPLGANGSNGNWKEYTGEFRKLLAGTPLAVSGNGLPEELQAYGKATWDNGSRASSACMNWMKTILQGQKLTTSADEAGQSVRSCLRATEAFVEESVECLLSQVRANSGLLKTSLLKETKSAEPVQ